MRRLSLPALLLALLLLPVAALRTADDPKAILDKAIQAHGGKDVLTKHTAEQVKTEGTVSYQGISVPFSVVTTVQLPDKFKNVMQFSLLGDNNTVVQVLEGDKAWMSKNGQLQPVGEKMRVEMEETKYADNIIRLVPLVDDKNYLLTALGESKVNGQTVVGVKVGSKGHRDIELYFDRETGLLAKTKRMALNGQMNAAVQEEYWSGYQKKDGILRPMKFSAYQDGQKFSEGEISDVKYPDKIDDKEFARP